MLRQIASGTLVQRQGKVGLSLLILISAIAFVGPFVTPYSPSEVVGVPFAPPGGGSLFGTDVLGRDVLSRFLSGGWQLITFALGATVIAYLLGGLIGVVAGYRGGVAEAGAITVTDILIAIPPIILALILTATLGTGLWALGIAIALVQSAPASRLIRSYTAQISTLEYVESARARGEGAGRIIRKDVLPNLRLVVFADFGVRFAWSVMLLAALAFLGLGQAPPATDWGLMINENRPGITVQPWTVLLPTLGIGILTISISLVFDAATRAGGRSSR